MDFKKAVNTAKKKMSDDDKFLSAIEKDTKLNSDAKEYIKKAVKDTAQYKIGVPYDPAKFDNYEKKKCKK